MITKTHNRMSSADSAERYDGKQFSILGDSISTFEGCNPEGYNLFYCGENCSATGVVSQERTWWYQVIHPLGGSLLVNNAWSGSRIARSPDQAVQFPAACSDERTNGLHHGDIRPDVVIIFMGTNDWFFEVPLKTGILSHIGTRRDDTEFGYAYDLTLKKLRANYPLAEVWCCTLGEAYIADHTEFAFPWGHTGLPLSQYNQVIRKCAVRRKCRLVDLAALHEPYASLDGAHPTAEGMTQIADMICRSII